MVASTQKTKKMRAKKVEGKERHSENERERTERQVFTWGRRKKGAQKGHICHGDKSRTCDVEEKEV